MKERVKSSILLLVLVKNLKLVYYPQKNLVSVVPSILLTDAKLITRLLSMSNRLIQCSGLGLAGPQAECNRRVFLMDAFGSLGFFINPKTSFYSSENHIFPEGCLSIPSVYRRILRSRWIRTRLILSCGVGLRKDEVRVINKRFSGILSACFQHEVDHLDGKLIVLV